MTIWDLQDKFHDSTTATARDAVREEMRDAGYSGVADTVRSVDDGGVDWRQSR